MQREQALEVLNRPLSQELMRSDIPARLAYSGTDGAPRVIPIAFIWNGAQLVACTLTNAQKIPALRKDGRVALTIDTNTFPPKMLLIRGDASLETVDGVPDEYLAASRKHVGDEGMAAFEVNVRGLYKQMVRITIEPTWAKLIDFETTIPSAMEELILEAQRGASTE